MVFIISQKPSWIEDSINNSECKSVLLSEVTKRIFHPPIFKRQYVLIPFMESPILEGTELLQFRPLPTKYLSKTMPNLAAYVVMKGGLVFKMLVQSEEVFF